MFVREFTVNNNCFKKYFLVNQRCVKIEQINKINQYNAVWLTFWWAGLLSELPGNVQVIVYRGSIKIFKIFNNKKNIKECLLWSLTCSLGFLRGDCWGYCKHNILTLYPRCMYFLRTRWSTVEGNRTADCSGGLLARRWEASRAAADLRHSLGKSCTAEGIYGWWLTSFAFDVHGGYSCTYRCLLIRVDLYIFPRHWNIVHLFGAFGILHN